jgi:hypothetical protein
MSKDFCCYFGGQRQNWEFGGGVELALCNSSGTLELV